jgi:calcineurin-like phosphoesterase family protein
MNTWFTSDCHFGHKNILRFCEATRPYDSVEEMDAAIIASWQRQVAPEDTVYIMGDVFFCKAPRALEILHQLPGQKHLILGNHDGIIAKTPDLLAEFASVSEYKTVTIDGHYVVMFHYPITEWDRMHHGSIHLYGHVHGKNSHPGRAMDVGIDARSQADAALWSWQEVKDYCLARPILSHH